MSKQYSNLYITDNLVESIKSLSQKEWDNFFDSLKKAKTDTIGNLSIEDLTKVQNHVNMIAELRTIFSTLHTIKLETN